MQYSVHGSTYSFPHLHCPILAGEQYLLKTNETIGRFFPGPGSTMLNSTGGFLNN